MSHPLPDDDTHRGAAAPPYRFIRASRGQRSRDLLVDIIAAPIALLKAAKYNRWAAAVLCAFGCLIPDYTTAMTACFAVAVATWLLDDISPPRPRRTAEAELLFQGGLSTSMGFATYALAGLGQGVTSVILTALIISAGGREAALRANQLED
jgi:hypothetical protein